MPRIVSLPRALAGVSAGLSFAAVAVVLAGNRAEPPAAAEPVAKAPPTPLFAKTVKAENPSVMVLLPDERFVHGWIAGSKNFAGKKVTVTVGRKESTVEVLADNTFVWTRPAPAPAKEPVEGVPDENETLPSATFTVPNGDGPALSASTILTHTSSTGRSVFFVTDRSAYRPGHTMKFAGYVRKLTEAGEFEPVANEAITVDLVSDTKQTRAARFNSQTDAAGKITGQYTFSDADALDYYTLSCANAPQLNPEAQLQGEVTVGSARVLLAEYRKSKVSLNVRGEVKDGKLRLAFDARDYLDRPVRGISATYHADVKREAELPKGKLDPEKFAHPEGKPPTVDDLDRLPTDERLLATAAGIDGDTFANLSAVYLAHREGKVTFPTSGPGVVELDLNADWLKDRYSVTVSGVLVDETGRENRATTTIPLSAADTRGVRAKTARERVEVGEKIPVAVETFGLPQGETPATTLVVLALDRNDAVPNFRSTMPRNELEEFESGRLAPLVPGKKPIAQDKWVEVSAFDPVKRKVVTVIPVVNGKADAVLKRPGAYKIVALAKLADGTEFASETGVVVQPAAKLPGVILALDSREIEAGSRLRGIAHTRFAGAKMFLTVRDSAGVRLAKPLTADEAGVAPFDFPLPANLRYGCAVGVEYPETATTVHTDQRNLFVVPADRTLTVTTKGPDVVGPGADVKLDVAVNRQEEVDLVVSVYDASLLGVAGDLSSDIRDFYLADARGQAWAGREHAARRVGNVTIAELLERAKAIIKEKPADDPLAEQLKGVILNCQDGALAWRDVSTLVRLTGQDLYLAHPQMQEVPFKFPVSLDRTTLADVLRWEGRRGDGDARTHVSASAVGGVVMLTAGSKSFDPWSDFRFGYGQFGYAGFGGRQFGQFGGALGSFGGGLHGNAGGFAGRQANLGVVGRILGITGGPAGGQMGMSHGFNRDLAGGGAPGLNGPTAGLGVGSELVRRDFADSAFWSATARTDKAGKATVNFKTPDSLTNWQVVVTAVSPKMHVGSGVSKIRSSRPVMIWPMLPRAFVEGDSVRVFGTVHNLTDKPQTVRVHLSAENGKVASNPEETVTVPANGNVPVYWTYKAGKAGWADLLMTAKSDAGSDASLKRLPVTRSTIEETLTASGLARHGKLEFTLSEGVDPSRATVTATVAPTLAADMADTLPYLVEDPHGCVEQTMSRFLPAILVAQMLSKVGNGSPELEKALPKVADAGMKRLVELQQEDGGWGWQGTSQTHEMMTPYALLGLIEAEKAGYPCPNATTIDHGLDRLQGFLNTMQAAWPNEKGEWPKAERRSGNPINDAMYILSVFARKRPVTDEWWKRIEQVAATERLSDYGHALALEIAVHGGKADLATKLSDELHKRAQKAGDRVMWKTGGFSRWGNNTVEITAAVMKALVARDPKDALIPGILAYFHSTKRGNRWDSTKDTAVVLYALCDYVAATNAGPTATGNLALALNDGRPVEAELGGVRSKTVKLYEKALKVGANTITVKCPETAEGALVRVSVRFTRAAGDEMPARDHGINVKRTLSVRDEKGAWNDLASGATVPMGSYVRVRVDVKSTDEKAVEFTLVESPKPARGETIPEGDKRFKDSVTSGGYVLREDRESSTNFHFERVDDATAEYVFLTEFAGVYRLPPARVERMYRPTSGGHSETFVLKVAARK